MKIYFSFKKKKILDCENLQKKQSENQENYTHKNEYGIICHFLNNANT